LFSCLADINEGDLTFIGNLLMHELAWDSKHVDEVTRDRLVPFFVCSEKIGIQRQSL
jgi:hypothetical protein